ncbi:MAG TPA: L-threonylcarbamoyladenylate synthase [Burkholderiales bacterium]|nr:L-threonylcarbamoyladenylate synthase [Burkholderiales bacterium]
MDRQDITQAVAILKRGGLVAFPTETVYGLGADAGNPAALRRLYEIKGRPASHPVIVHLADAAQLSQWAREAPDSAHKLAAAFWPGPLTLILKRAARVGDDITGGQDTIGLRVPAHPVAHALLAAFGGGIAAPSANRFGRVSATTADHVHEEFGDSVDLVLDGGACEVGIESTIIDVSGERPALLRPGRISKREIEQVLGAPLAAPRADSPRAPGTLPVHYAPRTPVALVPAAALRAQVADRLRRGQRVAVLARRVPPEVDGRLAWIAAPETAVDYARGLYANLRRLDHAQCDVILVEQPPSSAEWAAVADRLQRAAV